MKYIEHFLELEPKGILHKLTTDDIPTTNKIN